MEYWGYNPCKCIEMVVYIGKWGVVTPYEWSCGPLLIFGFLGLWKVAFLGCASKPGVGSLAPYCGDILDTPRSLAPFQAPARL